jgi:hypothetical protein
MIRFQQFLNLKETTTKSVSAPDLPPTILLRRIAIRSFPDGKQVAIYKDTRSGAEYAIPPVQEEIMK